uniref:Heparan-alpha-glucosaminide N-acetyltransferase catalytic domain-containing protein n=1 Tax=Strigamia maritima TaxID=126957 RepID=T1JMK5_STRMM
MGNFESRKTFQDFDLRNLHVDEAYLIVNSTLNQNQSLDLFELSSNCVKCAPTQIASSISSYFITKFDTKYKTTFSLTENATTQICSVSPSTGEFGIYELQVETGRECIWKTIKEPDNIYWPLLFALLFYLLLGITSICIDLIRKKFKFSNKTAKEEDEKVKKRLKSIDVFRGLSISLMIFVNMGGGGYMFFEHATWDGLLAADTLSLDHGCMHPNLDPIRSQINIIFNQNGIFQDFQTFNLSFLLGLMLGAGTKLESLRILGVLQRFSLTYLIVASICLFLSSWFEKDFKNPMKDVIRLFPHWIVIIIIIIIHTTITFCLPVPGCPTGYLGPGGDHLEGIYSNCSGGSAGYVDRLVLGAAHLFSRSTIKVSETLLI